MAHRSGNFQLKEDQLPGAILEGILRLTFQNVGFDRRKMWLNIYYQKGHRCDF